MKRIYWNSHGRITTKITPCPVKAKVKDKIPYVLFMDVIGNLYYYKGGTFREFHIL